MQLCPFLSNLVNGRIGDLSSKQYILPNKNQCELITRPFQAAILKTLFQGHIIEQLTEEVKRLSFFEKTSDIYKYSQTYDFMTLSEKDYPRCAALRNLFIQKMKRIFEIIFNIKITGTLSMSASKYKNLDHLLCHDDRCEDRHVAFIIYLSKDWDESDGGLFQMIDHTSSGLPSKVVRSVLPECNTLFCFPVTTTSFHQVSEVLAVNKTRLSISGWFHSPEVLLQEEERKRSRAERPITFRRCSIEPPAKRVEWEDLESLLGKSIEHYYAEYQRAMQITFVDDGSLLLDTFIKTNVAILITNELKSGIVKWIPAGPLDRRYYEIASMNQNPKRRIANCFTLNKLLHMLESSMFCKFLSLLTVADLDVTDNANKIVSVNTEVIRLRHGSYSLVVDEYFYNYKSSIDFWIFFNTGNGREENPDENTINFEEVGGSLSYVNSKDINQLAGDKIHYCPKDNAAFIVGRYNDCLPFIQYINQRIANKEYYAVHVKYSVDFITVTDINGAAEENR